MYALCSMSAPSLTVPTLKFRAKLSRFLTLAAYHNTTVTITRNGLPMAQLVPPAPVGDPVTDTLQQASLLSPGENSEANSEKNTVKTAPKRPKPARATAGKRRK